jgi:hypothetical protein
VSNSEGRPGRYQGVLSDEELKLIHDRYGDWLRERGYEVS